MPWLDLDAAELRVYASKAKNPITFPPEQGWIEPQRLRKLFDVLPKTRTAHVSAHVAFGYLTVSWSHASGRSRGRLCFRLRRDAEPHVVPYPGALVSAYIRAAT